MMKRFLSILLSLCLLASCAVSYAEAPETHQLEKKTVPLYVEDDGKIWDEVPLWLVDGVDDLPYMDLMTLPDFLNPVWSLLWEDETPVQRYTGTYDPALRQYHLLYEPTEASIIFSLDTNTLFFADYDRLNSAADSQPLDMLSFTGFTDEGLPETYARVSRSQFIRPGELKAVFLEEYGMKFITQDDRILLPMQTLLTILMGVSVGWMVCYNGEGLYLGSQDMLFEDVYNEELGEYERIYTELGNQYYSVPPKKRSRELAEYALGDFCLQMDCFYGLKESHQIDSFYSLITNTGLMKDFLDPDPARADEALQTLINSYLDDQHSAYIGNSFMTGKDPEFEAAYGYSMLTYNNIASMYRQFKNALMPDGRPAYQEVGDTAFVAFNTFTAKSDIDYYSLDLDSESSIQDTVSLIMFAHHQITREDSPVKNVVLDLTQNIGGSADAAIFVVSWFLGEAQLSQVHTFTGTQATNVYRVDVNRDRVFDEKDSLFTNYRLYCLCSPLSFSCGNLVPWAYHTSGMVTLIGDTTGGGSCVVLPMATAWGTFFQTSGPKRLAFIKNGSFYDIDKGVTPDVHLSKISNYFDREALTALIHDLP